MSKNLIKRVFTSLLLLSLLSICLFLNKFFWIFLLIIASIICFLEFSNLTKKIWKSKKSTIFLVNLISFFYLFFFIFSSYELSRIKFDVIFVLSICIFSDIGGYFIGRLVGGKKLTKISPNKTISGTIGSFVFSLISMLLIVFFDKFNENLIISDFYAKSIFFILIISFISQAGDLFISYFKRKAKVKDTGTILPGHGGLLDRIDGIIFALPSAFILSEIFFNI